MICIQNTNIKKKKIELDLKVQVLIIKKYLYQLRKKYSITTQSLRYINRFIRDPCQYSIL